MGGGSLMGGLFPGVGNEPILAGGGDFPHPPNRENPEGRDLSDLLGV